MESGDAVVQITKILQVGAAAGRIKSILRVVSDLLVKSDIESLSAVVKYVCNTNVTNAGLSNSSSSSDALVIAKAVVTDMISKTACVPQLTASQRVTLLKSLIIQLLTSQSQNAAAFEEELLNARLALAGCLKSDGKFAEAAGCLTDIQWTAPPLNNNKAKQFESLLEAFELLLAAGDVEAAKSVRSKAVTLFSASSTAAAESENLIISHELQSRFELLKASYCDLTNENLEAAKRYLDLVQKIPVFADHHHDHQQQQHQSWLLSCAAVCLILSPAGLRRNDLASVLFLKQQQSITLPVLSKSSAFPLLRKLISNRLVGWDDVQQIEDSLHPHHKREDEYGWTPLSRAIVSHNVYAASKFFKTISFKTLSTLLQISEYKVEDVVSQLIRLKGISGIIDGELRLVRFEKRELTDLRDSNARTSQLMQNLDVFIKKNQIMKM